VRGAVAVRGACCEVSGCGAVSERCVGEVRRAER
jgi:hypothetical protein